LGTSGFVSPYGDGDARLTCRIHPFLLFSVGFENRLLPASVVTQTLVAKVADIEASGRKVGGKERKRLREEVVTELLPQAFRKRRNVFAFFDYESGWLVVDTVSRRLAENVVNHVRDALGRFPATPCAPEESPRALLTDWVIQSEPPQGYALGSECDLRDPAYAGSSWNGRHADLETDEVREHLKAGMQVFRLGIEFNERVSFTLGEDLTIRKFHLLDIVLDEMQEQQDESAPLELQAAFIMAACEIKRVLNSLAGIFGIEQPGERE
jgi:recombination associated protein RdgC